MTKEQQAFITALRSVSIQIAEWAEGQIKVCGASIEDVKHRLRDAAIVAGRH